MAGLVIGAEHNFDLSKPSPQMNVMGHKEVLVPLAFDSSYPSGGESLAASDVGLSEIYDVVIQPVAGFNFLWDSANSKIMVYRGAPGPSVLLQDDDSAATTGKALHVVTTLDVDLVTAGLASVTDGNANTLFRIGALGPIVMVLDDNSAASNGTDLYFDEDLKKFLTVQGANHDVKINLSDGRVIPVYDDNSAASNGILVYCDDNASSDHLKLFIVATANADITYNVGEVEGGTSLAALTGLKAHIRGA
jgi:hypothetical protein